MDESTPVLTVSELNSAAAKILEHSFPSIFTILIEEHGQEKRISYGYNELFSRQLEMKYLE